MLTASTRRKTIGPPLYPPRRHPGIKKPRRSGVFSERQASSLLRGTTATSDFLLGCALRCLASCFLGSFLRRLLGYALLGNTLACCLLRYALLGSTLRCLFLLGSFLGSALGSSFRLALGSCRLALGSSGSCLRLGSSLLGSALGSSFRL